MPASKCTPWKTVQRPSGARILERSCGRLSAEVFNAGAWSTVNLYYNGKFTKRLSRKTEKGAKALASQLLRAGRPTEA